MRFFQPPDDFVEIAFADYVPSANDDVSPCLQRIRFFVLRQCGNGAEPLLGRARYDDDFAVPNRLFDQGEGVALGREYFFQRPELRGMMVREVFGTEHVAGNGWLQGRLPGLAASASLPTTHARPFPPARGEAGRRDARGLSASGCPLKTVDGKARNRVF